jgi:hypothetical protein
MGSKSPRSILMCLESLDGGRRTDAKSGDKAQRLASCFWRYDDSRANKEGDRAINRCTENSGMGHGAYRALVTGKPGVVSVYVDGLDDADEGDQEDT